MDMMNCDKVRTGASPTVNWTRIKLDDEQSQRLVSELYIPGHRVAHPELCERHGAGVSLLILVISAPENEALRNAVRRSWGSFARRKDVVLGFVIGMPPTELKAPIEQEDALHRDLIQGNSVDSYSNLTLKTLSLLEWADTYCPRAPLLLKMDDDVFVNVPHLLRILAKPEHVNANRTIWGMVRRKTYTERRLESRYYTSKLQFSSNVLPDYAVGAAYVITADAVRPLLEAAPSRRYLRLEDVFITGVLADAIGLKRENIPYYRQKIPQDPCAVHSAVAIHRVNETNQLDLWRKLLNKSSACSQRAQRQSSSSRPTQRVGR